MATTQPPPGSPRFQTDYDTARLIEVVRAVARHANPADPEAAAPAAYEAACAPAGFPDAPRVRATRRALGNLPWYEILHLAFHGERSLERNLGIAARRTGRPVIEQEAVVALRIIAARLKARTLRPHEHAAELDAIENQSGPTELPTADRIEAVLKTEAEMGWDRGLRLAGLEPRSHATPRRGTPQEDVIEMFVAELGYVPTHQDLKKYARLTGVPLDRRSRKHLEAVDIGRQRRLEKGLPWPTQGPARGKRPRDYGSRDARAVWTEERRVWRGRRSGFAGQRRLRTVSRTLGRSGSISLGSGSQVGRLTASKIDELGAGPARRYLRMRALPRFRLRLALTTVALLVTVLVGGGTAAASATSSRGAGGSSMARPAGSRIVRYHGYRLSVPASWPVYDLAKDPTECVRFDRHAVYIGRPSSRQRCPARAVGRTEAILVSPLLAHGAGAGASAGSLLPPVSDPNAQPRGGSSTELAVPSAGVLVTATWDGDRSVVQRALGVPSLPSPRAHPAAPRRPSARPLHTAGDPVYTGLGFDACHTPSSSTMSAWGSSPYRAIGVYIGGVNEACSQPNLTPSWVSQESASGWVLLPIYVGLQAPRNGCGCAGIAPAQASAEGAAAADDAANQAQALGIGSGSPIYDDMESYGPGSTNTPAVLAFLSAWTIELHARGYLSGVYSGALSGVTDLASQYGTGYTEPDEIWVAEWNGQRSTSSAYVPSGDWAAHQRVHQYSGGHDETYGGATINIDGDYVDAGAASGSALFPDGTFVQVSGSTDFYEIAGGAPLFVSSWSNVGGAQPYIVITPQQFAAFNPVPANGTFLETNTGGMYRIAGGAPMYVSAATVFGVVTPVHIDQWNIDNVGTPQSHLNAIPINGTFLTTTSGLSYRVAGGAAIGITNWSVFGGQQPSVMIDTWDIANVFNPLSRLAYRPAIGTMVQGLPSGAYWRFGPKNRYLVSAAPGAVSVDDRGLVPFSAIPCRVPSLVHKTLTQVKSALMNADCHLGKVHVRLVTRRRHALRVTKQVPRARTQHIAFYTVGVTLG